MYHVLNEKSITSCTSLFILVYPSLLSHELFVQHNSFAPLSCGKWGKMVKCQPDQGKMWIFMWRNANNYYILCHSYLRITLIYLEIRLTKKHCILQYITIKNKFNGGVRHFLSLFIPDNTVLYLRCEKNNSEEGTEKIANTPLLFN